MAEQDSHNSIVKPFQQAVAGLLVLSESDYPLTVSCWQGQALTQEGLLHLTDQAADSPVEAIDLAQFFAPLFAASDDATEQRWRSLMDLIETTLDQVSVYRVGRVEIDVYIVGRVKAAPNCWVMLATKVVET